MRSFLRFFLNFLSGHKEIQEQIKKNREPTQTRETKLPSFTLPEPHLVVGIVGATGHGKHSLLKTVDKIRHPNHPRFTRIYTKITIVETDPHCYWDGAVLIVSAVDGIVPQTRRSLAVLHHFSISLLVIYVNQFGSVNEEQMAQTEREIHAQLLKYKIDGKDMLFVHGSAINSDLSNVHALLDAIESHIPIPDQKNNMVVNNPFLMALTDVYKVSGVGTVACGWVVQGTLRIYEPVEVVGLRPTIKAVATDLEQFLKKCDTIYGGDNAGVLLRGVNRTDVERGQFLIRPGTFHAYRRFHCSLRPLTAEEGGQDLEFTGMREAQFSFYEGHIPGTLTLTDKGEKALPGQKTEAVGEMTFPYVIEPNQKFLAYDGEILIGLGVVTEVLE